MKTKIKWLYTFFTLFLYGLHAQTTPDRYDFVVSEDGAWTWYNDERAVFKNDRLYTSYVKKNGRVALSTNNIKNGTSIGSEVILSTWVQKDDHNNAAMLARQDGKIMAFYSPHIREKNNYYRTSIVNQPTKQSDWGAQVTQVTTNDSDNKGATYNNAFQLSAENGRIYNFMRTNNFNPNFKEYTSNGTPLRNGKDIILFKNGNGSVRPYVKYTSNNINRIDFFFTDGHPRNANNSLYHCYYLTNSNGTQGNIYQSNGALIASLQSVINGTPIDVSQVNKLYVFGSDGTNARAWTHNINYDSNNRPVVTYSKQININNITYHYARWTGTEWLNFFVSDAGRGLYNGEDDYTGIITTNPYNTNQIFMSSNRNPITGVEGNRYEIYSATTSNGGSSWSWKAVTKNSPKDNLRPYIPKGITNSNDRVVLWFYGDYITYFNYDTKVVGEYINRSGGGNGAPAIIDCSSAPTGLSATSATDTTVSFSFDNTANNTRTFELRAFLSGAFTGNINSGAVSFKSAGAGSSSITIAGLQTATEYDFVFRAFCPSTGSSPFVVVKTSTSGGNISTDCSAAPTGLQFVSSTETTATFSFDNASTDTRTFELRSYVPGTFTGNVSIGAIHYKFANAGSSSITITGLSPATQYDFVLRALCGSNGPSPTTIVTASTSGGNTTPTPEAKIDINSNTDTTKAGYTALSGNNNSEVVISGVTYKLFGFNKQPGEVTNSDALISDFAINNSSTPNATPAIGFKISGLAAGTYNVKSWHYDSSVVSSNIKVEIREAGFGNPITTLQSGISLGNTTATTYQINIANNKNYDLIFRSDNGTEARFNGIEITKANNSAKLLSSTNSNSNLISIYPVPFEQSFKVKMNGNITYTEAILYDLNGKIVVKQKDLNFNITAPKGMYILVVYNNEEIIAHKTILKK